MIIYAGVDASLTSTGLAKIVIGGPPAHDLNTHRIGLYRLASAGKADATLPERLDRVHHVAAGIISWCMNADVIVFEGPAPSSTTGSVWDRGGVWHLAIGHLHSRGKTVIEVPPSVRALYGSGKAGNASKAVVVATMMRRFPELTETPKGIQGINSADDNDVCDALVVACMGARWDGHPIDGNLSLASLKAMNGVHWPEIRKEEIA